MEEVLLLGDWPSAYCHRVVWALKIKGVEYRYKEEDLKNKSEDLLRYNPILQRIPVLVHHGKPVLESMLILEYVDEAWPHNPLLPVDPYQRAIARFWAKYVEDKLPTFYAYFRAEGDEQVKLAQEAKQILQILEDKGLGDRNFFGGNDIGFTDLCLGWIACWLELMQEAAGVEILESGNLPRLHAWSKRFKEMPVIKDNIPDKMKMLAYFQDLRANFTAAPVVR